jgi:nucleotide-binding universal stress UspA family protein
MGRVIVCGLDDSVQAAAVAGVAQALARRLGVRLRVVHSVHPDTFLAGEERRDALRRGEELLDVLVPDDGATNRVVELGDPGALLLSAIDDQTELVVVGSRGRGPARAAVLGSVSHTLAAESPCPVVVVPQQAVLAIPPHPTVVCGVDGSGAGDAALKRAASLARALDGRLVAVHVRAAALLPHATSLMPGRQPFSGPVDQAFDAMTMLERSLTELAVDVPSDVRVETGYPAARLSAVAAQEHATMVVVGSHRRGGVRAAVFGSVSSRLATACSVPVMLVAVTDA